MVIVILFKVNSEILFPPVLKEFERKEFIVTLTPSAHNIKKSGKVYKAIRLQQAEQIGEKIPSPYQTRPDTDAISINTVRKLYL